jgi:hypothetical protein
MLLLLLLLLLSLGIGGFQDIFLFPPVQRPTSPSSHTKLRKIILFSQFCILAVLDPSGFRREIF